MALTTSKGETENWVEKLNENISYEWWMQGPYNNSAAECVFAVVVAAIIHVDKQADRQTDRQTELHSHTSI